MVDPFDEKTRELKTSSSSTFYLQLTIFLVGFLLVVAFSHLYSDLVDDLGARSARERARLFVGEEIVDSLQEIEKDVYQMVATGGVPAQQRLARLIQARINKLEHDLGVLQKGGTIRRISPLNMEGRNEVVREVTILPDTATNGYRMEVIEIGPYLDLMRNTVSDLGMMLEKRDNLRQQWNSGPLLLHEKQISRYLKTVPPFFFRVNENANRMFLESSLKLENLETQLGVERSKYRMFTHIGITLVILSVMVNGFLFFRQVGNSSRRLGAALNEMRCARDEAELANHSKSQFLANMSHEIRTPMNGVLGMLDVLQRSKLDLSQLRLARIAYTSAEKLLAVINDILDFSKIKAGKLELKPSWFILRDLAMEVTDIFFVKAQSKNIILSYEIDEHVPELFHGDMLRLRQILINLLGNAVKFTEEGKISLFVSLENETTEGLILRFAVRDTGPGIATETLPHIFESFSQADDSMNRRHEGTGLGLAICKQLVEMMGGRLGVESAPGQGSLFWFTIRTSCGDTDSGTIDTLQVNNNVDCNRVNNRQLRVLLVEDNPVNQEVGRLILESLTCTVEVVEDGELAVKSVFSRNYDLVFMDCQMPGIDGYEATRMIRQREKSGSDEKQRIPIVALTAHAMEGDREYCLEAGMDDYLPKPYTATQVKIILQKWAPGQANGNTNDLEISVTVS